MHLTGANVLMGGVEGRLDGHAHVFRADLPMSGVRRYTPSYNATLADYVKLLRSADLAGSILVQPSFLGTDNSFMLDALDAVAEMPDLTFKGVVVLDPDENLPDLDAMSAAGVIGVRLNRVGPMGDQPLDPDAWGPLLRRVDDAGWHVEVHSEGARLAPILSVLLDRCRTVVVDHFGLPDPQNPLACPGHKSILSAPNGRVLVKTSGPYRVFPKLLSEHAAALCTPIFDSFLNGLGAENMLWGSDWPWTRFENHHSYPEALDWVERWREAA